MERHARRTFVAALLGTLLSAGSARAAVELAASGLAVPFFNDAGKLTHKIIAERGTMIGQLQHLKHAQIEYYAGGDPKRVVQRLVAAEAMWDEKKELLSGSGPIAVATEANQLSGVGFDFALSTARLNIHREFTMTNRELRLTSDRATVDLILQRQDERVNVSDIKRCEALGHLRIKIRPTATQTYHFEEAYSDRAIYDGATHTITLPHTIRFLRAGRESTANHFEIKLDERTRPAARKAN